MKCGFAASVGVMIEGSECVRAESREQRCVEIEPTMSHQPIAQWEYISV